MKNTVFTLFFFCACLLGGQAQSWFSDYQAADLMLSGAGFDASGGPLQLHHPSGIATDGTHFLVCDRFNNRILGWNTVPDTWNDAPDWVLGQSSFDTNKEGTSKSALNFPGNVSLAANGKLAVADTENDRILLWHQLPATNGQAADVSLHLPGYTPVGAPLKYAWPWGVWTDGTKLVAVATTGKALLFWNTFPTADNTPPDYVISHPHFGTPRNISTDGASYFAVGDHNAIIPGENNHSVTFFWNSFPSSATAGYDWYYSEWIKGVKTSDGKFVAGAIGDVKIWNTMPTTASAPSITLTNAYYNNGDGNDVALANGKLFVNNYNGNNVQVYNTFPTQNNQQPDWALSSPLVNYNTLNDIHYIQNPIIANWENKLIATSDFDRTLWVWNTTEPAVGQAPDVAINLKQLNLHVRDNAVYDNTLVLAGYQNVAVWNTVPGTSAAPDRTFMGHLGSAQFTFLTGAALDQHFMYIGERSGTIWLWNGIPNNSSQNPALTITLPYEPLNSLHSDGEYLTATIQNGEPYIFVFRVSDLVAGNTTPYKILSRGTGPNFQLPLNLCAGAITFNGSLAIANTNNHNVLLWENIEDAGDTSQVVVLGQAALSANEPGLGQQKLFLPQSLCAVDNHLWVGEVKFSSRMLRFTHNASTAVQEETTQDELVVFPNPGNGLFELKSNAPVEYIATYDLQGRLLQEVYQQQNIDLSYLPAGIYFLNIYTRQGACMRRIIKI